MINLIPNEEKKIMIRGFYLRLAIVCLLALGLIMFIASATLFPSYFLSSVKRNLITQKLEIEKKGPTEESGKKTILDISMADKKLFLLEKAEKNQFLVSERVIKEIILKKIPSIKITEISFDKNNVNDLRVNIRGTALSREKLLIFRRALEEDILFKNVDLPISNFVKGFNIQFYLSLVPSL